MRKCLYIPLIILLFISCVDNGGRKEGKSSREKEITDVAVNYARSKFNEPKDSIIAGGIIVVEEGQVNFITSNAYRIKYFIDPTKIVNGLIDDDETEDAIMYVYSVTGEGIENPEHLIIIQTDGKFILSRVIESNMKILGIKDRIITAEVSSRSVNTPLRDCHVCKEVVKYKFKSGDLVRI
jgi:hypothetical protein